jgi:hypothetical protein
MAAPATVPEWRGRRSRRRGDRVCRLLLLAPLHFLLGLLRRGRGLGLSGRLAKAAGCGRFRTSAWRLWPLGRALTHPFRNRWRRGSRHGRREGLRARDWSRGLNGRPRGRRKHDQGSRGRCLGRLHKGAARSGVDGGRETGALPGSALRRGTPRDKARLWPRLGPGRMARPQSPADDAANQRCGQCRHQPEA